MTNELLVLNAPSIKHNKIKNNAIDENSFKNNSNNNNRIFKNYNYYQYSTTNKLGNKAHLLFNFNCDITKKDNIKTAENCINKYIKAKKIISFNWINKINNLQNRCSFNNMSQMINNDISLTSNSLNNSNLIYYKVNKSPIINTRG